MAQNVNTSLSEDFLRCAICKGPYKEPKILPCLHSFCLQCLKSRTGGYRKQLVCLTCNSTVDLSKKGVTDLPKNSFLVSLMERLEGISRLSNEHRDYSCKICRNKMGTKFCLDCKVHFCQDCKYMHDHLTRSSDHQLMESEKLSDEKYLQNIIYTQTPYCVTHKQEKVRYYCTKCSVSACQVCATVSHQRHRTLQEVESKVSSVRNQMSTLLQTSESQASEARNTSMQIKTATGQIKRQILELGDKIDTRYREIEEKLQSDKRKLHEELQKIESEKCKDPEALQEKLLNWLKTVQNTQDMTRKIINQNNPWEILEMEGNITDSIEKLLKEKGKMGSFNQSGQLDLEFCPAKLLAVADSGIDEASKQSGGRSSSSENEMETNFLGELKKQTLFSAVRNIVRGKLNRH
ncbi:E3 ubiquitin-protein ligase TRIM56 [Holothuria leucospilota]|uniref:E3 ubiquitin-protein ligase TRIM56 n=1 Tax=Holothuria leucospilota TaxID=206669 RepID=A0A9Q1BDD4_HOLLE|nr:E3 ubiquitin-protein ligase TRIM56 [Holothuria leucospilota]